MCCEVTGLSVAVSLSGVHGGKLSQNCLSVFFGWPLAGMEACVWIHRQGANAVRDARIAFWFGGFLCLEHLARRGAVPYTSSYLDLCCLVVSGVLQQPVGHGSP